ncbi:MAG: hypothetical protein WDW36_004357 [Sanguina aurantia]
MSRSSCSPTLPDVDNRSAGMVTGRQVAFAVSEDHPAQHPEIATSGNTHLHRHPCRDRLTEASVRAADRRARFVGLDAYVAAGGSVMRDLHRQL